jgi:hypothetical protein
MYVISHEAIHQLDPPTDFPARLTPAACHERQLCEPGIVTTSANLLKLVVRHETPFTLGSEQEIDRLICWFGGEPQDPVV